MGRTLGWKGASKKRSEIRMQDGRIEQRARGKREVTTRYTCLMHVLLPESLVSFLPSKDSSISHLIFQSSALRNVLSLFLSLTPFRPRSTEMRGRCREPFLKA